MMEAGRIGVTCLVSPFSFGAADARMVLVRREASGAGGSR